MVTARDGAGIAVFNRCAQDGDERKCRVDRRDKRLLGRDADVSDNVARLNPVADARSVLHPSELVARVVREIAFVRHDGGVAGPIVHLHAIHDAFGRVLCEP